MTTMTLETMTNVYPYPAIRAVRIARMNEQKLGDFRLTAETAAELSEDEIGVLIGNCGSMQRIHEKLRKLAEDDYPADWVIVLQSRKMAMTWYNEQAEETGCRHVRLGSLPRFWRIGCCCFTTFEGLQSLADSGELQSPAAGILMVDPYITTHNCRGTGYGRLQNHDRPQLVVNFRTEQIHNGILPPLIFFSVPPAKALNTRPAESVYGLSAWWYADGQRLRVGRPPVV